MYNIYAIAIDIQPTVPCTKRQVHKEFMNAHDKQEQLVKDQARRHLSGI